MPRQIQLLTVTVSHIMYVLILYTGASLSGNVSSPLDRGESQNQ